MRAGIIASSRVLRTLPVGGGSPPAGWVNKALATISNGSTWYDNWDGTDDGSEIVITGQGFPNPMICLDDTYALCYYLDNSGSPRIHKVSLISRSGTTLTVEDTINVDTGMRGEGAAICWRNDTSALISACDSSGAQNHGVWVVTRSGNSISLGDKFKFDTTSGGNFNHSTLCMLTENKAVIMWRSNVADVMAQVLDISGTTITGNSFLSVSSLAGRPGIQTIDENHIVYSVRDASGSTPEYGVLTESSGSLSIETTVNTPVIDFSMYGQISYSNIDSSIAQFYAIGINSDSSDPTVIGMQVDTSDYSLTTGSALDETSLLDTRFGVNGIATSDEYLLVANANFSDSTAYFVRYKMNGNSFTSVLETSVNTTGTHSQPRGTIDWFNEDYILHLMTYNEGGQYRFALAVRHHGA